MDHTVAVTIIRHWFPIMTFCPVNKLPDLIYVSVRYEGIFAELYSVRRLVRAITSGKCKYMETLAAEVLDALPSAKSVTIRLAFNRHEVTVTRI